MSVIEVETNDQLKKIGFIQIKLLEEQLKKRVKDLGVKIIQGEFIGLEPNKKAVVITSKKRSLTLPYDILVGADGTHSNVRKALGIEMDHMGKALAISALIPCVNEENVDISPPIYKNDTFIRRILTPGASIIFSQSPTALTQEQFQEVTEECGWTQEKTLLAEGKGFLINDIEVNLQQSKTFSDPKKSAILIGDAAATASFFKGMGANTALKTAELAGNFFKDMQKEDAYTNFNQAMQETTSAMIEDSRFLFSEPKQ